jgi:hypothetical protein
MHADRSINFSRGVPILNEDDLRDCFAMFAMLGIVMKYGTERDLLEDDAYLMADRMLEARKPKEEAGIASVKRVRKAK